MAVSTLSSQVVDLTDYLPNRTMLKISVGTNTLVNINEAVLSRYCKNTFIDHTVEVNETVLAIPSMYIKFCRGRGLLQQLKRSEIMGVQEQELVGMLSMPITGGLI